MIYRIFNQGEIPQLATGYRSVIALQPGRKWIKIIDWSTLETANVEIATWARMKPAEETHLKIRKVKSIMKARLRYVTKTETIKEALKSLEVAA